MADNKDAVEGDVAATLSFRIASTKDQLTCGTDRQSSSVEPHRHIPERIGRFQIRSILGRGGFGTVYRAHDPQLDRDVALKIPRGEFGSDQDDLVRFLREARAAGGLRHPNIVPVFDAGVIDDIYFIASGFVEGETLRTILRSGTRFSQREAVQLVAKLAAALDYAHQQKIVHRDVKPDNVIVDAQGEPHLLDFGLARREEQEGLQTQDGMVLGTPAYMSPEQARGQSRFSDSRTDLWALGVLLYELLTGQRPFDGTTNHILHSILHYEPIPLRQHDRSLSRDLETIVAICLAKHPEDRYTSCGVLLEELERFLRGEPVRSRPISLIEQAERWRRREPKLAAAFGVVAFSLLLVAVLGSSFAIYQSQVTEQLKNAATELSSKQAETKRALGDVVKARNETESQRQKALVQLGETHLAKARQLCVAGDAAEGALWLCEAMHAAEQANDFALARSARLNLSAWQDRSLSLIHLEEMRSSPRIALASPDGSRLLVVGHKPIHAKVVSIANPDKDMVSFQPSSKTRTAAYSQDGRWLATISENYVVEIWDASTGKKRGKSFTANRSATEQPNPDDAIRGLRTPRPAGTNAATSVPPMLLGFSRDGNLLAVSVESTVQVWAADSGVPVSDLIQEESAILGLGIEPQLKSVTTLTAAGCGIRDFQNISPFVERINFAPEISAAALSADGEVLISVNGREVNVTELTSGKPLRETLVHNSTVIFANICDAGKQVIAVTDDHRLHLWDIASGQLRAPPISLEGPSANSLAQEPLLSPNGEFVATATADGRVWQIWNASTGESVGQPLRVRDQTISVTWTTKPNCFVVTSIANTGESGNLQAWEIELPTSGTIELPEGFSSRHIASTESGEIVAYQWPNPSFRRWTVDSPGANSLIGRPAKSVLRETGSSIPAKSGILQIAVHPLGTRLALLERSGHIQQYSLPDGEPQGAALNVYDPKDPRYLQFKSQLAYDPSGRVIIASINPFTAFTSGHEHRDNIEFQIWDAACCLQIGKTIIGPSSRRNQYGEDFHIGRDSQFFCAFWNREPQLYDLRSAELVQLPSPFGDAAQKRRWLSPNGTVAIWRSPEGEFVANDLRTSERIRFPEEWSSDAANQPLPVVTPLVTSSGELVVIVDQHTQTTIWDPLNRNAVGVPLECTGGISELAISPDKSRLLVRGRDNVTRMFSSATGRTVGLPHECPGSTSRVPSWSNFAEQMAGWSAPFSGDSRWLVTLRNPPDRWQLWDAATGQPIGPERPIREVKAIRDLLPVSFSAGSHVLVEKDDSDYHGAQLYSLPQPQLSPVEICKHQLARRVGLRIDRGQSPELISASEWATLEQPHDSAASQSLSP